MARNLREGDSHLILNHLRLIPMPLNPAQYTERRDTLASLLTETAAALQVVCDEANHIEPGLIQRHISALRAIRTKVFEDQFKLVLVARFQGGKSTTFNAVAMGGRVISPMGDGAIKCSASLISNRNCEDPAERGVTLKWRTNAELALLCEEVLTRGKVDLDSPEGRITARKAFEVEFENYQSNRNGYNSTKLELLPIIDLITRFVGDPDLTAMQARLALRPPSETEVADLVRFPKDFSMRWPDQAAGFTLEDARFVFLQAANMASYAPKLKQLGLEVVDCPGLFASSYDTSIAEAMILTADAVWYLLDGKSAGETDLKAIAKCRDLAKEALFVSVNLKADINPTRKHITTKIIPHIQGQLQQAGLTVELQPYHALLALLGQTGESLLRGESDLGTSEFMHQLVDDWSLEASPTDAAGDWAALAEHLLDRLKSGSQAFREAGGKLNAQTVGVVNSESGLSDILEKLEQFVVKTRAQTVLIDRGVAHAIEALENGVERPLSALEVNANRDEETARHKFDEAKMALSQFLERVEEQLKFIDGEQGELLDRQLADELFERVILPSVPMVAEHSAKEIVEKTGLFKNLSRDAIAWLQKKLGTDWEAKSTEETIKSIIDKHFTSVTRLQAQVWSKEIDSSPALKSMLNQASRINANLQDFWQGALAGNEDLRHLSEPVLPQAVFDIKEFSGFLDKAAITDVGGFLATHSVISGVMVGIAVLLPGIGTSVVVIATVVGVALDLLRRGFSDKDQFQEETQKQLTITLEQQIKIKRSEIIVRLLTEVPNDSKIESASIKSLRHIRRSIIEALQAPIRSTIQRFDMERRDAEALFKDKSVDRAQIAEDCRRLREERVVPLRKRLQTYQSETQPMC